MSETWFKVDPHLPLAAPRIARRGDWADRVRVRQGGFFSRVAHVVNGRGRSPVSPAEKIALGGTNASGGLRIKRAMLARSKPVAFVGMPEEGAMTVARAASRNACARVQVKGATKTSSRTVAAAAAVFPDVAIAEARVDLLDNRVASVAFLPGGETVVAAVDFPARQAKHRFFLSPN